MLVHDFFEPSNFVAMQKEAEYCMQHHVNEADYIRKGIYKSGYGYVPAAVLQKKAPHISCIQGSKRVLKACQDCVGMPVYTLPPDQTNLKLNVYRGNQLNDGIPFHYDSPIRSGDTIVSAVVTLIARNCQPMLQKWTPDTGVQEYLLHENTLSIHIGDKELHRVPPLPVGGIRVAYIMFFTVHTKLPPLPRRIVGTWVAATKGTVDKMRIYLRNDCPEDVFGFPEYISLASVTLIAVVTIVVIIVISRKIAKHSGNLGSAQRIIPRVA